MPIQFLILQNRQGKTRLTKWFTPDYNSKQKQKILREIGHTVTSRSKSKCNFIEWRQFTIVYKRYASLFFIICIESGDNEILAMELIHQYVEVLDSYFGNVCELDLIFNFDKAHYMLDELVLAGSVMLHHQYILSLSLNIYIYQYTGSRNIKTRNYSLYQTAR